MCDGYYFKAALDLDIFTYIYMNGDEEKSCSAEEIAKLCEIRIDRPEKFLNCLVCSELLEQNSNNRYKLTNLFRNLCCKIPGEENYGVQ